MRNKLQNEKITAGCLITFSIVSLSLIWLYSLKKQESHALTFENQVQIYERKSTTLSSHDLLINKHLKPKAITEEDILLAEKRVVEDTFRPVPKQTLHKYLKASRTNLMQEQALKLTFSPPSLRAHSVGKEGDSLLFD